MKNTRLAAGTLALVLPLATVAACGAAEKKRTVKAEFASAQTNLEDSKSASFTLRLDDSKDRVRDLVTEDDSAPEALVDALLGGSITYIVDPVGSKTFKDVSYSPGTSVDDLKAQLEDVNFAFVIRDDKAALGEIRLVDGNLYAQVNVDEISRLAEEAGVDDVDAQLDDFIDSAGPEYREGLEDVRDGKWIKLPLLKYIDQFQELAESFTDSLGEEGKKAQDFDAGALGQELFDGIRPHIKVTAANDDSATRVLDVKVDARPALKAALKILAATDDLPFPNVFADIDPSEVDDNINEGTANGTVTMNNGHLSQVTIDVESIRKLAVDPGTDSLEGTEIVLDVDDSADEVKVPDDVSSFDLGAVIDDLLEGFTQGFGDESSSLAG